MNKISYKLGVYLFILILLLQGLLAYLLYTVVVKDRVEEQVQQLLVRSSMYSHLLMNNVDNDTMEWIRNVEKDQHTTLVITDESHLQVLLQTNTVTQNILNQLREGKQVITSNSTIMKKDWKRDDYMCVVSPIFKQRQVTGYVYLFQDTNAIRQLVKQISETFLVMTILSLFVTTIVVYVLTVMLTKPILRMKKKTKELMKRGNPLQYEGKRKQDEIQELEYLIECLGQELGELKEERNAFLASIAHELRTPLTYIKGYSSILNKHDLSDEKRKEYTQIIKEETESLTALIENLFLLARLDKNEFVIHKSTTNMPQLFQKVIEKMKGAKETYRHDITFIDETVNGVAYVDGTRMEQVIVNVLTNAMRYDESHSPIVMKLMEQEDTILFSITDKGKGISEEEQRRIFEPFYRVEKGRTRSLGGYGLGLAIVKEIIQKHDGEIRIQSEENKGTTITILLPKGCQ